MLKTATIYKPHTSAIAHYVQEYQRVKEKLPGHTCTPLTALREMALKNFATTGFPTKKHPDWKYTTLQPFLQIPFAINTCCAHDTILPASFNASDSGCRLVFVNGHFSAALSTKSTLPADCILDSLTAQIKHPPQHLVNHWRAFSAPNSSFINLNSAFMQDGAYLYLPANVVLTTPIELLFLNSGEQQFIPVRNIIIADENSRAVIIEKHVALHAQAANTYFSNSVTECILSPHSHVTHYKCIEESEKSTHISDLCVTQQANSQFFSYSIAAQGGLVRSDTQIRLCEAHAQCQVKGLYHVQKKQHVAHYTVIDHLSPETKSKEFYKGIVRDDGHAVFNGKVIVRAHAIKSHAEQLNKNLLLSPRAEVNTTPQLEIFVDDIQCTHGASIGQLDENALFYLRTRGINADEARLLLVKAFIQEIAQQMPLYGTHPLLNSFLSQSYEIL